MKYFASISILFCFFGSLTAEHELGIGVGYQKTNDQTYNIKFRESINAYYRYGKERNSFWLDYNHSFAKTTQTLIFGGWGNPNRYYKTVTLHTQIICAGIGYSYNLMHRPKSKIAVGSNIGVAIVSDGYNVTNTRERFGVFAIYSFNKIFIKNLSASIKVQRSLLGNPPLILDANVAFRNTSTLNDLSIQLAYRLVK